MPQSLALCLEHRTERPDGTTGFGGPPNERGEVYTGYWIDERYRNRGYVTEAVQALVNWAFENPAVSAVTANTPEDNLASQRVLVKTGFQRRG